MKQDNRIKKIFEQLADHERRLSVLEEKSDGQHFIKNKKTEKKANGTVPSGIDFTPSARAFFKQYTPVLAGPKKFVLTLAYLVKGDTLQEKTLEDISNQWARVAGLMGGKMERMYSTRAKENDWVDSPKVGIYKLRPTWQAIFN